MSRKAGAFLLAGFSGVILLALGFTAFHLWLFTQLPGSQTREIRKLYIQPGMSGPSVAQLLYENGVVSNAQEFYLLSWFRRSVQKLQAGEYAFVPLSKPDQILDQVVHGRVILYTATLPEGSTVRDVARILDQKGLVPEAEVLRLVKDGECINGLGLQVSGLEGYLFPETYVFKKPINGAQILKAMVTQFRRHLPDDWQKRSEALGYDLNDIVIVASMIEKEAVIDSERPLIAAVFYNRLKLNMPLQSDPTAVYDIPDFSGPVTAAHLKRQSPYNTYQKKGLPIGPICNPGARSLHAAFFPGHVRYLYFVSNNDGSHHFSETLSEHQQAVSQFIEKRKGLTDRAGSSTEPQRNPAVSAEPPEEQENEKPASSGTVGGSE